jgi:hypothetical protein
MCDTCGCQNLSPQFDKVQQVQGMRRSNAAGPHPDKRTKRNRDRATQKRRAIEEQQ